MFTLKMKFNRFKGEAPGKPTSLEDEATEFILADKVVVHGYIRGDRWDSDLSHWDAQDYSNLLSVTEYDDGQQGGVVFQDGRLITAELNGKPRWFLTSNAWLIGPDGKTIERLAP